MPVLSASILISEYKEAELYMFRSLMAIVRSHSQYYMETVYIISWTVSKKYIFVPLVYQYNFHDSGDYPQ